MKHHEYARILPEARIAVLFIHGIVGTPRHFTDVVPLIPLVPEDWSVYNVLLEGHGGKTEDFSRSGMKEWKKQVWDIFLHLAETHEQVVIAAHSMGTLFAIELAVEFPEKIPALFLLAVPLKPGLRLFGIQNMMRLVFDSIDDRNPMQVAVGEACGVNPTKKLWKYLGWTPRFVELLREIAVVEEKLDQLCVPCMAYQSQHDELVRTSSECILQRCDSISVRKLSRSSHFYYHPSDLNRVKADFLGLCKKLTHD